MPKIEIRKTAGTSSANDLTLSIQDKTFEYLMTTSAPDIRISAYFEQDYALVEKEYAEAFLPETFNGEACKSKFTITKLVPGSRVRKPELPGEMKAGEQLTLQVVREDL